MVVQGSRTFEIQLNDGRTVKRHLDHVRIRTNDVEDELPDYLLIDHQPRVDNEEDSQPDPDNTPPGIQLR